MFAVVVDKMRGYLAIMVCLLLGTVSSDARNVMEKHGVESRSNHQPHVRQYEMPFSEECASAYMRFILECGVPPEPKDVLEANSEEEIYNKLLQVDLREVCTPYVQWYACATNTLKACSTDLMFAAQQQIFTLAGSVLNYVCVQEVDVLNRHKACLLRVDDNPEQARGNQFKPILVDSLLNSCLGQLRQLDELPQPYCSLQGVQRCAKPIIAEQCGNEIANVIAGLADRIHSAAQCPSLRLRSTTHYKRQGLPSYAHPFKFLKSLF